MLPRDISRWNVQSWMLLMEKRYSFSGMIPIFSSCQVFIVLGNIFPSLSAFGRGFQTTGWSIWVIVSFCLGSCNVFFTFLIIYEQCQKRSRSWSFNAQHHRAVIVSARCVAPEDILNYSIKKGERLTCPIRLVKKVRVVLSFLAKLSRAFQQAIIIFWSFASVSRKPSSSKLYPTPEV